MAQLMTVRLSRQDVQPWGFRLQGGKDFGTPLVVQKVNGGSIADQAGIIPGDAVIKINNIDVFNMRHKDAQDVVVRSGHTFDLTIQRGGSTWRPSVTPTGSMPSPSSHLANNIPTVTRTSLAHRPQEVQHIGCGYNNTSRPFSSVNGNDGSVKSIINKQYNTPVGIYSEEAIAETLSAQAEVLAGGVLGVNFKKNEKIYNAANSEVLKMLHEQENDKPEPVDNQQQQQHIITSPTPVSHYQQSSPNPVTKHVIAPIDRPKAPNSSLPAGQNICSECERLIVGVFIRIKDKNLHSECFKCATCGTSLKNQGYFNFKNKLYCDVHARQAAINNPPKGTDGYFPIPIKPTQKLSASTISAALDAHVQQHDGSNHINTGYGGPKPFNNNPISSPMRGPLSPSIYPPPTNVQSWGPSEQKPKPQMNPYATLPRAAGQSQGTTNLSVPLLFPFIEDSKQPHYLPKVGTISIANIQTQPPLPTTTEFKEDAAKTPAKSVQTSSCNEKASSYNYPPEHATEVLASSIERVEICDKQNLRDQTWLQKHEGNIDHTLHASKNVTKLCDNALAKALNSSGLNIAAINFEVSTNGKIFFKSSPELGSLKSVAHRKKSSNPNGKRELSMHAFDRRSYIHNKDNNNDQTVETVKNIDKGTTDLVDDLKDGKHPICCHCNIKITRGPFITALGQIWCPDHFVCVNGNCHRALHDIGFVEEKGDLYCEYCFEIYLAPTCNKCNLKIKGDCLNAIGKHFHPECFTCSYCGKVFGNSPFFLEEGEAYCEADWNELFTTKCFACGFPVEAGDRWVEALNHNYHSQCFNCTMCRKNLEGQSFYNKGGRPFCKNHAR